jgi:hypothetical protein
VTLPRKVFFAAYAGIAVQDYGAQYSYRHDCMLSRSQICPAANIADAPLIITLIRRRARAASLPFLGEDYKHPLRKLLEHPWPGRYREKCPARLTAFSFSAIPFVDLFDEAFIDLTRFFR